MRLALALLLLSGCAVTPDASLRRQAYGRLRSCVGVRLPNHPTRFADAACLRESARWCSAQGMEATCGSDEFWSRR